MFFELLYRDRIQNPGHFQALDVKIKGSGIFGIFLKNGCFHWVNICKTLYMPERSLWIRTSKMPYFFDEALRRNVTGNFVFEFQI